MTTLGTEKIEAILTDIKELVVVAKKVQADKKVDLADLPHFVALLPKLPAMLENFKAFSEAIEEGKDIDVAEVVALIQKVHQLVKEVEAA
jgi:hypothetical protein